MTTRTRPTPSESRASDALAWGAVHLDVTDLARAQAFWQGVIGLEPMAIDAGGGALGLGAGDEPLVVLHPGATGGSPRGHSGLYHLALHVPSEADFAAAILRAAARQWPQAPTDHITHWATYLDDPDGIQVEIAFETPDRVQRYEEGPGWPVIVDSDGRDRRAVEPLDVDGVLAHARDGAADAPMVPGTVVGHMHLHVRNLHEARDFYADVIGMTPNVAATAIGFADLSFGGAFPHRMAVNTWQRPGAPRPEGAAGMRMVDLRWHDRSDGDAALARLEQAGALGLDGVDGDLPLVRDPSGTLLRLITEPFSGATTHASPRA